MFLDEICYFCIAVLLSKLRNNDLKPGNIKNNFSRVTSIFRGPRNIHRYVGLTLYVARLEWKPND